MFILIRIYKRLINTLRPDTIRKIHAVPQTDGAKSNAFKKMENIDNFRKGCIRLGLKEADLFSTIDLFEEKDLNAVYVCLFLLQSFLERKGERAERFNASCANINGLAVAGKSEQSKSTSVLLHISREAATRPGLEEPTIRKSSAPATIANTATPRKATFSTSSPSLMAMDSGISSIESSVKKEEQIKKWIEEVLQQKFSSSNFMEDLKDGTVLCRLMNCVRPNIIANINYGTLIHKHLVTPSLLLC